MSFQSNSETDIEAKLDESLNDKTISGFEKHIIQCCKAPEWELRKWLKKVLTRSGFQIFEDAYKTERVSREKRYDTVHNMLAIRGENPRVVLVAHTDVCRDHSDLQSDRYSQSNAFWMNGSKVEEKKQPQPIKVEPVIKNVEYEGVLRRIIQDKECKVQVGGDDRLGVAINTWIALNTGYSMGLFFPTDEEIGLKSARACEMKELKAFDLAVEVDRGNHSNEIVIKIGGEILCTYDTGVRVAEIAYDLGMPRSLVCGAGTDVAALKSRGIVKEAINMTCGYHNSIGASPNEYIDIEEARNTMTFVNGIVKDYYLNP